MILKGARLDAFLRRPDPAVRAVLFFGPDRGLVRERADALVGAAGGDAADPFATIELDPATLKSDPARLVDEAAALSFSGRRRVVRLREATDAGAGAVEAWLGHGAGEGLVLVECGDLSPRSALRKLAEKSDTAVAVGCYPNAGPELERFIIETLAGNGVTIRGEAAAFLAARVGADRALVRGELDKIALYVGAGGTVTTDAAAACIGDSSEVTMDMVADAACRGDGAALDRALAAAATEGASPVALLRATARHVERLMLVVGLMARGDSPDKALAALRPPVFFKLRGSFLRQASSWSVNRLATALELLTAAEIDCKSTGLPDGLIAQRTLMRIAQAARAR